MTLIDPCPTTQLTLLQPSPLVDQVYKLRDAPIPQPWTFDSIVVKASAAECGPYEIEFFNDDALQTPIDLTTFDNAFAAQATDPNEFSVLYTDLLENVGSYPIKYRVRLQNYPGNVIESPDPFTIDIIDPCSPPTTLLPPILENQEYTITDVPKQYQIPEFTVNPPWCDITYTYTITAPEGDAVVDFDSDSASRTFTFSNLEDIYLSGTDFTDFTITVTAESGNTAKATALADFDLRLNNPCVDPTFTDIITSPMPIGVTYELYEFNITGFDWQHQPFVYDGPMGQPYIDPIGNTVQDPLCGNIVYDCLFMGLPVDTLTEPVSYDTST